LRGAKTHSIRIADASLAHDASDVATWRPGRTRVRRSANPGCESASRSSWGRT